VLSIMILPTVISLSEDALRVVPVALREGSAALGRDALRNDRQAC
jgi:phosphate transport system permease protein